MGKITKLTCLILIFIIPFGYSKANEFWGNKVYKITNIKIYKNTPSWDLAKAVNDQNISEIERIVKDQPKLINYQESKYGATLLMWAVGMEKYESAEILLECGADPNIATIPYGETPLFQASSYSWVDSVAKKDPKYVKLLLSYGADPNKNYIGSNESKVKTGIEPDTSPLMNSIGAGIEKTRALVEGGADINHKSKSGGTAAQYALYNDANPSYAHYLIVEKQANIADEYYRTIILDENDDNEKLYLVNLLRFWVFDLDSEEYKMKMEIVEEFARQGVDYWDTSIPKRMLNYIKKRYPGTWEEYIKKY